MILDRSSINILICQGEDRLRQSVRYALLGLTGNALTVTQLAKCIGVQQIHTGFGVLHNEYADVPGHGLVCLVSLFIARSYSHSIACAR